MIQTIKIGERTIVYKGIGQLYYESGIPISLSINEAIKQGYEVSLLHVADELIKHGYSRSRIIEMFRELKSDNVITFKDLDIINIFINKLYEDQREMIYNYLFNSPDEAKETLRQLIKPNQT